MGSTSFDKSNRQIGGNNAGLTFPNAKEFLRTKSSKVIELNDGNFNKEVLQAKTPVLVLMSFRACPHCRSERAIIEELAGKYKGKIKFAELSREKGPKSQQQHGRGKDEATVDSYPRIVLSKGGKRVELLLGFQTKQQLESLLNKHK